MYSKTKGKANSNLLSLIFILYLLVGFSYVFGETTYAKYSGSNNDDNFTIANPSDTQNIIGNYEIIGNTVECTTDYNSSNSLEQLQSRPCYKEFNRTNNNSLVKYIDIDHNPRTNVSSEATLKLPSTFKNIKWVGLFWQGHVNNYSYQYTDSENNKYYSDDLPNNYTSEDNIKNDTKVNQVLIKIGDDDNYHEVNATKVDYRTSSCTKENCGDLNGNKRKGIKYGAYGDITSLFKNKNF